MREFKVGDIVQMKPDVSYGVTLASSIWTLSKIYKNGVSGELSPNHLTIDSILHISQANSNKKDYAILLVRRKIEDGTSGYSMDSTDFSLVCCNNELFLPILKEEV